MHPYHAKVSKVRAIYKGPCMHPYHAKVSKVRAINIGSLSHLKRGPPRVVSKWALRELESWEHHVERNSCERIVRLFSWVLGLIREYFL